MLPDLEVDDQRIWTDNNGRDSVRGGGSNPEATEMKAWLTAGENGLFSQAPISDGSSGKTKIVEMMMNIVHNKWSGLFGEPAQRFFQSSS